MLILFFKLIIAHAVCDFPLQGDFLGKYKNRHVPSPVKGTQIWWLLLLAHALIQAGGVWLITNNPWLALFELTCHFVIDLGKNEGLYSFNLDQAAHIVTKIWICNFVWAS